MLFSLKDKKVLIIGGSYGMGLATAEAVLEAGGQVAIAARTVYCPVSKGLFLFTLVPIVFVMASPSNAPFVFSLNRRQGFDGNRCAPTHKYLYLLSNVYGCSRAVNLAENCYGPAAVCAWIGFVSAQAAFLY